MALTAKYDKYASNVSLLLPFDADLTDYSATPKTMTAYGNAAVSATQRKYGAKSCYFDGNGDYLTTLADAAFAFGTGDFTVEAWIYPTVVSGGDRGITDFRTTMSSGWTFFIDITTSTLKVWDTVTAYGNSSTAVPINQWSHAAISRQGTTLIIFLNGIIDSTMTMSTDLGTTRPLGIGGSPASDSLGSSPFAGYIDSVRVTKGIARYTANFTVPTTFFQIEDAIPLTASSLQMFAPPSPWMDNVPAMVATPSLFTLAEEIRNAIPFLNNPAQVFAPKVASAWQDFIPRYSMTPQVFNPTNYRPPVLSGGSSPVWTRTANNPRFIKTEV